jgi:hypothetical protein
MIAYFKTISHIHHEMNFIDIKNRKNKKLKIKNKK